MKRLIYIIMCICCGLSLQAKTVEEMFISAPDSILPYMEPDARKQIIDLKNMEPDSVASINNAMGNVKMTRLGNDMLTVLLSDDATMEIGQLADNSFVVIKTYGAPERESTVTVCDSLWQSTRRMEFSQQLFNCDSLSEEQRKWIEFPLVEAQLGDTAKELILTLHAPMLTKKEQEEFDSKILQRKVNWNGQSFK